VTSVENTEKCFKTLTSRTKDGEEKWKRKNIIQFLPLWEAETQGPSLIQLKPVSDVSLRGFSPFNCPQQPQSLVSLNCEQSFSFFAFHSGLTLTGVARVCRNGCSLFTERPLARCCAQVVTMSPANENRAQFVSLEKSALIHRMRGSVAPKGDLVGSEAEK
jgi:hypothetical protein